MRGRASINFENTNGPSSHSIRTAMETENWKLITVVKNNNRHTIYENGIKKDSRKMQTATYSFGDLAFSNSPCIGVDGTNRYLGFLDDLRIYNRALTLTEIQQLYLATQH